MSNMKLNSSFADVRAFTNDLHTFIASRHFGYRGGLFRVALIRHNGIMRFAEGALLFQREKMPYIPKTDYGDVLFLEEWVEPISAAENYLAPFLSGQQSIAGHKIGTQFIRTDHHHQDVVQHVLSGWREWRFLSRADFMDNHENSQLSQEPLTRKGLPPYLNVGHAIADRVFGKRKWENISSPYYGLFVTILPETRARLLSGEWRPGSVHFEIETTIPLGALELQLLIDFSTHRENRLITPRDTVIEETIPLDAQSIQVFLVEESGECLSRVWLPSLFSTFGPEKPSQGAYHRTLTEISNGENDHVEYKAFIEPKNAKEKEIIKTTIAFANTLGGRIYIGVESDGALQGEAALCATYHSSPERARAALTPHFQELIVENIKPVPAFRIDLFEVKQQPVLVISVEAGNRRPYSNRNNAVWIRKGASDVVPDPQTEFPRESAGVAAFPFPEF